MNVSKKKGLPIYYQIADEVRAMIEKRELLPGDLLPSENELTSRFCVSRGSVRKALQVLTSEGFIETFPGKGSVVAKPKQEYDAGKILGYFSHIAKNAGHVPTGKTLQLERMDSAPAHVCKRLKIEEGTPVIFVRRVRFVDNEPWTLETIWYIEEVGNTLFDADLENGSLYEHLQEQGIVFLRSKNRIYSASLNGTDAELLEQEDGAPAMVLERVMYQEDDRPCEFSEDIYRADRIRLSLDVNYQADSADFSLKPYFG